MKHALIRYWPHIALTAFGILAWAIIYPVYLRVLENQDYHRCSSNLKQMGLAIMQYSQDYDDRLPLIRVHAVEESLEPFKKPYGWADALYPYGKSLRIYQCVREENFKYSAQDAVVSQFTDYYYNSNLNGIEQGKLSMPSAIILFGEGNDGTDGNDARYNRNVIPQHWLTDRESPARRHPDGTNYAYADGHVRWLKPQQVKSNWSNKSGYSFALR